MPFGHTQRQPATKVYHTMPIYICAFASNGPGSGPTSCPSLDLDIRHLDTGTGPSSHLALALGPSSGPSPNASASPSVMDLVAAAEAKEKLSVETERTLAQLRKRVSDSAAAQRKAEDAMRDAIERAR